MIHPDYTKYLRDMPFSSVRFAEEQTPFYVNHPEWCAPNINAVLPYENVYPHWAQNYQLNHVFISVHSSIYTPNEAELYLMGFDPRTGIRVVMTPFYVDPLGADGDWTSLQAQYFLTPQAKGSYTLQVVREGMGGVWGVLADTTVNVVGVEDIERLLVFTYSNRKPLYGVTLPTSLPHVGSPMCVTFTVHGGIKIGATKHVIDQDDFRDQRYIPHSLSPAIRKTLTLTVGDSRGVPEYVGETINQIMSCDTVFVNGIRIHRDADSVPEVKVINENYGLVNFTVDVEVIPTTPDIFDPHTLTNN